MARLILSGAMVEVYQKDPTSSQYVTLTEIGGKPVRVTVPSLGGTLAADFKALVGQDPATKLPLMWDLDLEVHSRDFVDKESGRSNQSLQVSRVLHHDKVAFVRAAPKGG